jgi:hypothetical protein
MKLLVITERGRVVGTQPVTPPAASAPTSAVLRAGPGQKGHLVDVAVPGGLSTAREIEAFHRLVASSLRPRKTARKKPRRR